MKRIVILETCQRKKMKVHKSIPELTLTEDDTEMVTEKV